MKSSLKTTMWKKLRSARFSTSDPRRHVVFVAHHSGTALIFTQCSRDTQGLIEMSHSIGIRCRSHYGRQMGLTLFDSPCDRIHEP